MEQIKGGKIDLSELWIGTCKTCGAEFVAPRSELNMAEAGCGIFYAFADCPACNTKADYSREGGIWFYKPYKPQQDNILNAVSTA